MDEAALDAAGLSIEQAHPDPSLHVEVDRLERLLYHVLQQEGGTLRYLGVILADRDVVLALNRQYLHHDHPTDVLSFSLAEADEPGVVEGEVYVDLDTAFERHAEFDATFEQEVGRYAVHGLLHLLGYDDATPEGKATMHALEDRYLASVAW